MFNRALDRWFKPSRRRARLFFSYFYSFNYYFQIFGLLLYFLQASTVTSYDGCRYGDRGSLTALCVNATPNVFRDTPYRFDHLDETVLCLNCTLPRLRQGTFDISGNKIQILNLSSSRIESIGEKTFTGLVFLETLILSDNKISWIEEGAFHGARKIKKIYLDNALSGPLNSLVFSDLIMLKELHLKNNSLVALPDKTFYGLSNLEFLDLSYNKLRALENSLMFLKSLKTLLLNNNEIVTITSKDLQGLQGLLQVDLSNNLLNSLNFNLTQANSLKKLNLSNNHLGNAVVKLGVFEEMHELEVLDMSLNWFKLIPPKLFRGLYNLRELYLSNNTITSFHLGSFSGLPSLRIVNVSHNNIEEVIISGKLPLHQLHVVDFSDNKIQDFSFFQFTGRAPKLNKVFLSGNLLSCKKRRQMAEYSQEAQVHVVMELRNCPQLEKSDLEAMQKEFERDVESFNQKSPGINALKIVFLLVILVLIGLQFYIHFYVLSRKK